jgi:hypothetical protein
MSRERATDLIESQDLASDESAPAIRLLQGNVVAGSRCCKETSLQGVVVPGDCYCKESSLQGVVVPGNRRSRETSLRSFPGVGVPGSLEVDPSAADAIPGIV